MFHVDSLWDLPRYCRVWFRNFCDQAGDSEESANAEEGEDSVAEVLYRLLFFLLLYSCIKNICMRTVFFYPPFFVVLIV